MNDWELNNIKIFFFFSRLQEKLINSEEDDEVAWMDLRNGVFYQIFLFCLGYREFNSFPNWHNLKFIVPSKPGFFFCLRGQLRKDVDFGLTLEERVVVVE